MLDFADAALLSKISYAFFGELEDQPFLKRSTLKDAVTKGTQDMPNIQVERESGSRCQPFVRTKYCFRRWKRD
jgi:hypothetical protein